MILLLLLCSCGAQSSWQVSHLQTGSSAFDSSRALFCAKDPVNGIDLELIRSDSQIFAYLLVHTQETIPYEDNPKEAIVRLIMADQTIESIAHRHEGGQRILLTESLQQTLLDALKLEKDVTIELMGYRTTILGKGFPDSFAALQKTPIRNPLQPPVPL